MGGTHLRNLDVVCIIMCKSFVVVNCVKVEK